MNRHHRRAERAACRDGAARVPRKIYERQPTRKEVDEMKAAYKLVVHFLADQADELRAIDSAAMASVLLDFGCMFLASAHLRGERIEWEGIRKAMRDSFADHLNQLRKKKDEDQAALRGAGAGPEAGAADSERED